MRIFIIVGIVLLCSVSIGFAETRGVTWTHDGENLTGFKIYEHLGNSANVVMTIDKTDRRADLEVQDDGVCHIYMITAYNGNVDGSFESPYSNILAICPSLPNIVNDFKFEGSIEVIENN